jgi:anti-sigma regulatory factor (Ser/Thr protein kinase)
MAASEALTNVVVHAYRGGPGQIHAMAWALREDFWLLVADDGCGLRSGEPSNGLGRGLALMAQLADELTIVEGACGGTEVRMRFMLGARDRASHAGPFAAAA